MNEENSQTSPEKQTGTIGLSSDAASTELPHLTYEETPVIEPVKEPVYPSTPSYQSSSPAPKTPVSFLKALVGFVILFIIGFAVSGIVRQALSPKPESDQTAVVLPTATPMQVQTAIVPIETTASGVLVNSAWKIYPVLNGLTRKPVENISYQLPSDVAAPACDGGNCASQGTYLPGKTRFTVAPRGQGQVLADYRTRAISDLRGNAFTVKETTVAGKKAVEFSGDFSGSTAQGFGFTKMHGFMVEVTDTISLEMNHFIPSNLTADFAKDDVLFDQIVKTIVFTQTPTIVPTDSVSPAKTMIGTSSASPTGVMLTK